MPRRESSALGRDNTLACTKSPERCQYQNLNCTFYKNFQKLSGSFEDFPPCFSLTRLHSVKSAQFEGRSPSFIAQGSAGEGMFWGVTMKRAPAQFSMRAGPGMASPRNHSVANASPPNNAAAARQRNRCAEALD